MSDLVCEGTTASKSCPNSLDAYITCQISPRYFELNLDLFALALLHPVMCWWVWLVLKRVSWL